MFDAHLHLRDQRILPYHARFVEDALRAGVTACIDCASRPEEWNLEIHCDLEVIPSFGLHPWYALLAYPDWREFLTCALNAHPEALIGEIGLDGIRKVNDGGAAQRSVLNEQLEMAVHLRRPIVVHGARAWPQLFRHLEPWAERLPAILLHGVSFSAEYLHHPLLRHRNVWMSVGCGLLALGAKILPNLVQEMPLDRMVVETDAPDMFPIGGDPLVLGQFHALYNQPGNLRCVIRAIARLRGMPEQEVAELTEANTRAFLATRGA